MLTWIQAVYKLNELTGYLNLYSFFFSFFSQRSLLRVGLISSMYKWAYVNFTLNRNLV